MRVTPSSTGCWPMALSDRPAERHRQAKPSEAWVQDIEQNRVFDREQPGQPGILDIVDREPRLQAGKFAWGTQETFRRLAQLACGRGVLGIEYDQEIAAHQRPTRC